MDDNHSDSDSVESWTLVDSNVHTSSDTEQAQEATVATSPVNYDSAGAEKDEETDGISIISDCESESAYDHVGLEEVASEISDETLCASVTTDSYNSIEPDESPFEVFLNDQTKLKTYVHKRNNKVSSLLNLILMGSVLTAAGIALGHMWGAKEECSQQTDPQVNQLLSNLYKLQEENALLRNKLKELSVVNGSHAKPKKTMEKRRCKKVFEQPLDKVGDGKITKCVDPDVAVESTLGKLVKAEIALLQESKDEVLNNSVNEKASQSNIKQKGQIDQTKKKEHKRNLKKIPKILNNRNNDRLKRKLIEQKENVDNTIINAPIGPSNADKDFVPIVTYAESLKQTHFNKLSKDDYSDKKKFEDDIFMNNQQYKRKYKVDSKHGFAENLSGNILLEDDDPVLQGNYKKPKKFKPENKKSDRKQKNKKDHKRRNKYQQWEMKGGYMKDYESVDSISVDDQFPGNFHKPSNYKLDIYENVINKYQEKDHKPNIQKTGHLENDSNPEKNNFVIINSSESKNSDGKMNNKVNKSFGFIDEDWFSKRTSMRRKAREELLKRNHQVKMNARWYFRRMKERQNQRFDSVNDVHNKNENKRNYKQRR